MVTFKKQKLALCAALFTSACGFSQFATAQDDALEEVVVTGFKSSLAAALDLKSEATGQVDAIMAEDMADFPDLNLAESLQRIPGVAITRSNGEGSRITVRGLSGQYTRTRINGMEARAGIGTNNTRQFDFNMFASELFNSIVVHKTQSAEIDEGSIGATVDLNTADALDLDEGHTFLISGTMQYNDLSEETDPRVALLYGYNAPSGKWGATASIAFSELNTALVSANTVRWQRTAFNSVNGTTCDAAALAVPGDCLTVRDNFHARIPRYVVNDITRDRIGATLGLQFQPTDSTLISFDALLASYDTTTSSRPLEVLFRGNEGGMDVTSYTLIPEPARLNNSTGNIDGNGTIVQMGVDNAWVRSEHYYGEVESDFNQFTLTLEHEFSDSVRMDAMIGSAESEQYLPVNTTLMFDDRDYDGFSYDYRTGRDTPILAYNGPDVTDATIYQLTDLRDQVHTTDTENTAFEVNVEWDINDGLSLKSGLSYKSFDMVTRQDRRDGTACALLTGGAGCLPGNVGIPMTQDLAIITTYTGAAGAGSTTRWATPNIAAIDAAYGYYATPLNPDYGRHRDVEETNTGVFVQLSGEKSQGDMRFLYDVGFRYVETEQTSAGYNSGIWVTFDRPKYDDFLPSVNAALWLNEELVVRMSYADTLSRPSLSQLSPGGSVNSFSDRAINYQNPRLDPTRASNMDIAAEWYFGDGAMLGFAYFTKNIESFPITDLQNNVTFASSGLPYTLIDPTSPWINMPEGGPLEACNPANGGSGCWDISSLKNGPGADVHGWELAFQAPFDVLFENAPAVIRDMGIIANYTDVTSTVLYTFNSPSPNVEERLQGLSNEQWNLTLYYEGEKFSTRVSWAYRSDYISGGPNANGNLFQIVEDSTHVDLAASYDVTDQFAINLEVVNLTDEPYVQLVDKDARRIMQYDLTGTNILLGARYKF